MSVFVIVQQFVDVCVVCVVYCVGSVVLISGVVFGFIQVNLIVVFVDWVFEMLLYVQCNLKLCFVFEVIEEGQVEFVFVFGSDICIDIGCYCIWCDGELVEEVVDVCVVWDEYFDLVVFLIGCSFIFEIGFVQVGILIWYQEFGCNVLMYCIFVDCVFVGCLWGEMVVLMWFIVVDWVVDVVQIFGCMFVVYGVLVYVGDFVLLGIVDLLCLDFGDVFEFCDGEILVFWVCGVILQVVIMVFKLLFVVMYVFGYMFIIDVFDVEFFV